MMRTTRSCSTAMALVLVAATPALAQTTWTYSDIDQDGNLELSSAEFEALGRELFVTWDADQDQIIGENEFYGGVYDAWDVNDDDILTEAEYSEGWGTWFGDYDEVAYGDLDLDGDAELIEDEFHTGFGQVGVYDTWATDGELGEDQFVTGLYDVYDADDDLVVTQAEYDVVGTFWMTDVATTDTLEAEVISLADWTYDDLYAGGFSAEDFIDEMVVYGVSGEEIGEVEDIIIGADGQIASIVAEVGGFWDIGDTHVSIPFDEVAMTEVRDGIVIPVTEDTVGDYGFDQEVFSAVTAADEAVSGVDDAEAIRGWRASELIGDYARVRDGDAYGDYGYVSDLILRDGAVAAVVVQPDAAYGAGYRAYPYYGYEGGYGWNAGSPFYDMPYDQQEVGEVDVLDYERFE
ncbi:PRC-barrel domain-containing protein [Citreimonas salinaria]|uniref:PRC-barrel domain-containing protein n=1 Tax=Citreimonas salinaria TaxID=321339 RepID=A0A1H3NKZ6_9RHOB|nr:PRC-barrel domain-containing protein [Citreimonas salinaria]SDY89488.1 PRC-barrel domain-containing protein [Citreimonas salinaria]